MKVYFLPLHTRGNPYIGALVAALRAEGVEVLGRAGFQLHFLPPLLRGGARVLHLHWLWGITRTGRRGLSLARLAIFLAQLALARALRVRVVFTAHNLKPHESPFPGIDLFCTRWVIRLAHCTIVHGESAVDLLARELGLPERARRRMVAIHHGHYHGLYPDDVTRAEARARLGLRADEFVFAHLGMLRPYKGVLGLVDAFRRLEREGARLVIAGRPRDEAFRAEIERAVAGDRRILFRPGFVPEQDVQVYVKAADVMVFPFEDVLSSGSVILGLSFGRTCVAPRTGCIRDVVREDEGYLYDPARPDGLLEAMRLAHADREHAAAKGLRAMQRALTWTWQEVASQSAAVYRGSPIPAPSRPQR